MKERLFYWGTVIPLTVILLYQHDQIVDRETVMIDQIDRSNKQLEVMADSYTNLLTAQSKRHADEIVTLETHHKKEIGECIEFYDRVVKETEDKIRQQVTAELTP